MSYRAFDRSQKQGEQYRKHFFLVERVLNAYVRVTELPLLAVMNYDPDAPQQHTLGRASLDFKLDVEQATEEALDGFPALQQAWISLALGEKVPAATQRAVVTKCGKAYQKSHCDPNVYFHHFRRGGVA